jgi:hypothetical protein
MAGAPRRPPPLRHRLSHQRDNNLAQAPSKITNFQQDSQTLEDIPMARVALVTGGSRGIGEAISKALKAEGYEVAATYAGNDEKAAAFTEATGIKTYKWNVADYEASKAGIAQVEADLGPIDIVVANAGITRDAVPQDDARAVERGDRHQPHRRLQHRAPGLARHARAQVRPGDRDLLDQRPEGPDGPGELCRDQGGRSRHRQEPRAGRRARRHHRQRDLPRLHRHRDGHGHRRRC